MKKAGLCFNCKHTLCHRQDPHVVRCLDYEKIVAISNWMVLDNREDKVKKMRQFMENWMIPLMKLKVKTMNGKDISGEATRSYHYIFFDRADVVVVKIQHPQTLFVAGTGHAFHRVWDGLNVHLCHAPGPIRDVDRKIVGMCFLSWEPKNTDDPVKF